MTRTSPIVSEVDKSLRYTIGRWTPKGVYVNGVRRVNGKRKEHGPFHTIEIAKQWIQDMTVVQLEAYRDKQG